MVFAGGLAVGLAMGLTVGFVVGARVRFLWALCWILDGTGSWTWNGLFSGTRCLFLGGTSGEIGGQTGGGTSCWTGNGAVYGTSCWNHGGTHRQI